MNEAILEEIDKHRDIIIPIPFDPKIPFPNTVTPGTVLTFRDIHSGETSHYYEMWIL